MTEPVSELVQAAYRHDWETVTALRERDGVADVFEAAVVGDLEAVRHALDDTPDAATAFAPDGFTPLHLAAYFGRDEVVPLLLAAGADPDAVAANGTDLRPLHAATAARSPAVVAALLEAGADPGARQAGGFTPLMAAAKHGDVASLQRLLAAGADPQAVADDGSTARSLADPAVAHVLP